MKYLEKKSCLIGMLMGDSSLDKTSSKSARFSTVHCERQKEYLFWKKKILDTFSQVHVDQWVDKRGFTYWRTRTQSIPEFLRLRNQMYFHGRKSITSHLMKILDWRGIAIWFLDDGCIQKNMAQFATNMFTEAEHYLMKYWLEKVNGISVSVNRRRRYYFLNANVESTGKIVDWVKKLDIPSMEYKITSYGNLSPHLWGKCSRRDDDIV